MSGIAWDQVTPVFAATLRPPRKPERPSDMAVKLAQQSYEGKLNERTGEVEHVMRHRFPTVEMAEAAADELKRAQHYTDPVCTVSVKIDPDGDGDNRLVAWRAGNRPGRKSRPE